MPAQAHTACHAHTHGNSVSVRDCTGPSYVAASRLRKAGTRQTGPRALTTLLFSPAVYPGKPTVALNIYKSMRQTECSPNVVTYNTLIDVYGKLGQWEDAVRVIDVMQREVRPL